MAIEYLGLSEVNGPLVVLEGVKNASYEEIVEFTVDGNEKKLGHFAVWLALIRQKKSGNRYWGPRFFFVLFCLKTVDRVEKREKESVKFCLNYQK